MQTWTILTAIALVAAIPMAIASDPQGCDIAPAQEETHVWPLNENYYIVVSPTENLGFWKETNGEAHLQTKACKNDDGSLAYAADEREDGFVLA